MYRFNVYSVAWRRPTVDSLRISLRIVVLGLDGSVCLCCAFPEAVGGDVCKVTSILTAAAARGPPVVLPSETGLTMPPWVSSEPKVDKTLSRR